MFNNRACKAIKTNQCANKFCTVPIFLVNLIIQFTYCCCHLGFDLNDPCLNFQDLKTLIYYLDERHQDRGVTVTLGMNFNLVLDLNFEYLLH